jgi:AcrR family transcriptional regulator
MSRRGDHPAATALPPWVEIEETPTSLRHPERRRAVVGAALALADREGFDAVSMRRVAAELGWGTMTLYSYVVNKDQLVLLMAEELGAQLLVPPPLPADWRAAITAIARNTRRLMLAHPWVAAVPRGAFMSPALARHVDQTFEALSPLDDFTIGTTRDEIAGRAPRPADAEVQRAHIARMLLREDLPHLARAFAQDVDDLPAERQFEQGLAWLVRGIEVSLTEG